MRKCLGLALAALLFRAPLAAQTVAPIEAAPGAAAPGLSAAVVPSVSAMAAPLAAPSLSAPAFAAAPSLAAAPAAVPATLAAASLPVPAVPAAAAAIPAAQAAALPAIPAASDAPDLAGRALFDQARPLHATVDAHSSRPLDGVFIQQEHEGSLLASDARDSSGDVFRYYAPVEMRPALVAQTEGGLKGFDKFVYTVKRSLQLRGRSSPEAAWRAWPLSAKLDYLDRLEAAIAAERGPQAVWDGKVSLIMERKPGAPDYIAKNPHMEAPPEAYRGTTGARYLQPEIVTSKDHPSSSVREALGRARTIVGDTGHAGLQFHVFVKAAPKDLLAQMDSLDGALQLVNDVLFARAATESDKNITHASLRPWHRGRSERVRALLMEAGGAPHVPSADDQDSEKHASVGFRYWGMEDGKAVVSLELRGTPFPFKRNSSNLAHGMDNAELPKRDYEPMRSYLTALSLYAEALARGRAPRVPTVSAVIDEKGAEAYLRARADALGVPEAAYDGLEAFARRMTGEDKTPQGYLFPFAASAPDAPELRTFADQVVILAARTKAADEAGDRGNLAHMRYLFWGAYSDWARRFLVVRDARLAGLAAASAR